jgi:hypothetical protein
LLQACIRSLAALKLLLYTIKLLLLAGECRLQLAVARCCLLNCHLRLRLLLSQLQLQTGNLRLQLRIAHSSWPMLASSLQQDV